MQEQVQETTENQTLRKSEEDLREMASHSVLCQNGACEKSGSCLRYRLLPHLSEDIQFVKCVHPRYRDTEGKPCPLYKKIKVVTVAYGLTKFYNKIPTVTAKAIKSTLIHYFGKSNYYRYRNGELPIKPSIQYIIEQTARRNGWKEPLVFDRLTKDYE